MSSTDVYELAVPAGKLVLGFTLLVILSLAGVGMLILSLADGTPSLHFPLILFWCAASGWNWYVLFGIPYEIRFDGPDRLVFIALRGSTMLSTASLHSLEPGRWPGGLYVLRHADGKIRLVPQITGFHEAITRIKAANPNFRVVGI